MEIHILKKQGPNLKRNLQDGDVGDRYFEQIHGEDKAQKETGTWVQSMTADNVASPKSGVREGDVAKPLRRTIVGATGSFRMFVVDLN